MDQISEAPMHIARTRHHITLVSSNKKTGRMTIVRTDTRTCPDSCPLLVEGSCYDMHGNGNIHRTRHDRGQYKWVGPGKLFDLIKTFSDIWRLNEGGDLWGRGDWIDGDQLWQFVKANIAAGKVAIVYTHKPIAGVTDRGDPKARVHNKKVLRQALKASEGTINVSCDSLEEVDRAMARGFDTTVTLPMDAGKGMTRTPEGNRVVTCPATYGPTQCVTCGSGKPLCARKDRGYSIGFPGHGGGKRKLSERLRIVR